MAQYSPKYNAAPVEEYLTKWFGKPSAQSTMVQNNAGAVANENKTTPAGDGSAGYGDKKLDTRIYTRDTAPEKIRGKFVYYFKKFPEDLARQLQMDEIASFSVTEATFADQISEAIASQKGVHNQMSIVDATACVGGNSMSFGKYFQYLTAVELDPKRAKMLEHNLDLCKRHATFGFVANKRVFCGDYTKLMRTQIGRSDIIFFDPPWGGMDYKNETSVELSLGNRKMHDIVNECSQYATYVVLKLPKNYNMMALKRGITTGQIIYHNDLSNARGIVKMKLVIVVCQTMQNQAQQHQRRPNQRQNTGLQLVKGSSPIKSWEDALASIKGGIDYFKGSQSNRAILPRGIYSEEDDLAKGWTHIMKYFPNGVPCFKTNAECIQFCATLGGIPTNPRYPHLQHVYTTLIGWKQVLELLYYQMKEYRIRYPTSRRNTIVGQKRRRKGTNRFNSKGTPTMLQELEDRCNLPFFKRISEESTMNSLLYMFFHMRCGIFVMIRNHQLQMFVPFVNDEYRNTFSHLLEMDCPSGSMDE